MPLQAIEESLLIALPQLLSALLLSRLNCSVHFFRDFPLLPALRRAPQTKINGGKAAMRLGILGSILDEVLQQGRCALVISFVRTRESELVADADFLRLQLKGPLQIG